MIDRLYDVSEGEILIDGHNVKDYSLEYLRNQVGMVLQKNTLFSGKKIFYGEIKKPVMKKLNGLVNKLVWMNLLKTFQKVMIRI